MRILPLANLSETGLFAIVDDDDFNFVTSPGAWGRGWRYLRRPPTSAQPGGAGCVRQQSNRLHRVVLARQGHNLKGRAVGHWNGWALDNRKENLWIGNHGMNARTSSRPNVHLHLGKYRVQFGPEIIGDFPTEHEARQVYTDNALRRGFTTPEQRAELIQPVLDQLMKWVDEGLLVHHDSDALLIEDRFRMKSEI